jgi:S-formylglutathione hydrolase
MYQRSVLAFLAAALLLAATHDARAAAKHDDARLQRIVVHGESLAGNLAGDSPDRQVSIYLPPSYAKQPHRRYPVLYLLHGFTDSDAKWFGLEGKHFVNVPTAVDAAFTRGVAEMIVVMPNAFTRYQGSMYSNSAVTGDWETFIARELVRYVDAHYRTLARPESRGLAGHSMGGYGTLRLAMKMPGVFSVIYAMSPCCLAPNSQPDPQMFARAATVRTAEDIAAADFLTKAMLASAAAWSPNPKNPPLYFDLPVVDGKTIPETLAEWAANAPISMFHQYIPALKSYRAMAIDAGDKDAMIAGTVVTLHGLLDEYSIPHTFEIYPGDHVNRIEDRLTTLVLPFFGERLQAQR